MAPLSETCQLAAFLRIEMGKEFVFSERIHYFSLFALSQRLAALVALYFTYMKRWAFFLIALHLILLCTACQEAESACPTVTGTPQYLDSLSAAALQPPENISSTPFPLEIGGQQVFVDKVVQGPLCNDSWQGVVYVGCDVQVYSWREQPLFLKDCDLSIAPGTVVYVAAHNDTAYYNGCSCHTGENENVEP